ncbi:MAG: hypothetical protein KHZ62_10450 [Clostridiales bacterium]|nr:hypothetical protein [Clostridiales bacterium]
MIKITLVFAFILLMTVFAGGLFRRYFLFIEMTFVFRTWLTVMYYY